MGECTFLLIVVNCNVKESFQIIIPGNVMNPKLIPQLILAFILLFYTPSLLAQKNDIEVTNANGVWTIAGKKQIVTFKESDLSIRINAGNVHWNMVPSGANDMIVKCSGKEFAVRLADAGKRKVWIIGMEAR
jgi:hypothetical protein